MRNQNTKTYKGESKMRNKYNAFLLIISILLGIMIIGCSKDPAPYTQEASHKLSKAAKSIEQQVPKPGMSKEDGLKMLYNFAEKFYSKAGYDLEKSIIQFESDLKKDPTLMVKLFNESATVDVIIRLLETRKDKTIDVTKALPPKVINALDSIAVIQNEQAKIEKDNAASKKAVEISQDKKRKELQAFREAQRKEQQEHNRNRQK